MRRAILVLSLVVLPVVVAACSSGPKPKPTGPAPEYEPGRTWVGTGQSAHPVGSSSAAPH
ncbi:MAG: hypothetical protein U0165_02445 [Polyangiaceae bacterium]